MSGRLTHRVLKLFDSAAARLLPRSRERASHLVTGSKGEEEVYFYLRKHGYVMVARNWRSPRRRSEIDLIGWEGDTLCFVEVKTRTSRDVMPAEAAVDRENRMTCAVSRTSTCGAFRASPRRVLTLPACTTGLSPFLGASPYSRTPSLWRKMGLRLKPPFTPERKCIA